jgi:hypothetical protein
MRISYLRFIMIARDLFRRLGLRVFALALVVACASSASAQPCTQDSECDNGDTCSVSDVCSSGTCVLGAGGDVDSNLVCDGEFNTAETATITRLLVRKGTTTLGNYSSVLGSGDFVRDSLDGDLLDADVGIRIKDVLAGIPPAGDGVDVAFTWQPADCTTSRSGMIRCQSADHLNYIRFRPNRLAPEQISFSFRVKGVAVAPGPFFGPVRTVLTHNVQVHRTDLIEDCRFVSFGIQCREF